MSYPYRCTRTTCRKRVTLPRRKEDYVREPRCRVCGGSINLDKHVRPRDRALTCRCDAFPFPHRAASSPFCVDHPTGPTVADWDYYYGDRRYG